MTTTSRFNDSSRKRLAETTYFPGQRVEGYIELDVAQSPSSRLDVTLRRVIRYSALESEENPTGIKSVSSLVSQHQLVDGDPQQSTFLQDGSADRLPFSLILPEGELIPSIAGHIEYEATLTGDKGRILDSIAPISVSPWDSASTQDSRKFMITRPWTMDFSPSKVVCAAGQIPVEPKSHETDAYHFAKHGLRLALHHEGCRAGRITPVMLLVIATEARKVDVDSVDWDFITPKLPGEPGYKDEFEVWLQPTITSTSNEQNAHGDLHYSSHTLPENRIGPVSWRTGHLHNRDGSLDIESVPPTAQPFACPGYGFSAPSINRADNDWPAKMAYLIGDLALPPNVPPSFELATNDGWIKLEYELHLKYAPEHYKYEDSEQVEVKVTTAVTSGKVHPSKKTDEVGVDESAPPLYSE